MTGVDSDVGAVGRGFSDLTDRPPQPACRHLIRTSPSPRNHTPRSDRCRRCLDRCRQNQRNLKHVSTGRRSQNAWSLRSTQTWVLTSTLTHLSKRLPTTPRASRRMFLWLLTLSVISSKTPSSTRLERDFILREQQEVDGNFFPTTSVRSLRKVASFHKILSFTTQLTHQVSPWAEVFLNQGLCSLNQIHQDIVWFVLDSEPVPLTIRSQFTCSLCNQYSETRTIH